MNSTITTRGQVTLPEPLRQRFGLRRGHKVTFTATRNGILIKPENPIMATGDQSFWKAKTLTQLARAQKIKSGLDPHSLAGTWPGSANDGFDAAIVDLRRNSRP